MTTIDRSQQGLVRYLALLAVAVMAMALLPLTGTANAQEPVANPDDACPQDPPPAPYTDRDDIPDVHVKNVDCITHRNIAEGFTDDTYRPRLPVRRDQMAAFVARTIEEAGYTLPAASEHEGFDDTDGNTHEDRIRQLAAAEIVLGGPEELSAEQYGPERRVRRDQMASFLIRAAEYAFDQDLGSNNQQFTDVPSGNVHFENVNAAAEYNLALGGPGNLPATQYGPALHTRRDQMGSFLARLLVFLEQPPEEVVVEPETLELNPAAETNPVGTDHTVTATVTGANDAAIVPQVDVRFEVYRDLDPNDLATPGNPVEAGTAATVGGDAEFTYTGPADPAEDLIVACVVDDPTTDECTFTLALDNDGNIVAEFTDGQVGDTATKTWAPEGDPGVAPAALVLDPPAETNTVGTDHTVTATVTGANDAAIDPQVDVRFEVYRDLDPNDLANAGAPVETDTVTTTGGTADFTYTFNGPGPAEDLIVACVVDDPATDECTFDFAVDNDGNIVAEFTDGQVGGTATKSWVPAPGQPAALTLDPPVDDNPVGTNHTVTATVTDANGEPIDPQVDVRFEVYRDLDPNDLANPAAPVEDAVVTTTGGTADFTYTGPAVPAFDLIVACVVEDPADECAFDFALDGVDIIADFTDGQVGDAATKAWVLALP